jgi:ketosteroid isomerase-like protein
MSQKNVEIVRTLWRAFERREVPSELFAQDVEWHTASDMPDSETCKGAKAIQRMLADGWENVTDPGMEAEEFRDTGERVVVRWRGWGKWRASGLPIDWREAHTYQLRDGKIVEVREYRTWEQALEAVGLAE